MKLRIPLFKRKNKEKTLTLEEQYLIDEAEFYESRFAFGRPDAQAIITVAARSTLHHDNTVEEWRTEVNKIFENRSGLIKENNPDHNV